jgi:hypothetical protein
MVACYGGPGQVGGAVHPTAVHEEVCVDLHDCLNWALVQKKGKTLMNRPTNLHLSEFHA